MLSILPSFFRATLETFSTKLINSLFLATKSVSLFISIIEKLLSSSEMHIKPSAAILSILLLAFAMPCFLSNSIDFSISPFVSSIAFLQSLNPTPVISLNCFTFFNKLSATIKIYLFYFYFLIASCLIFEKIEVAFFSLDVNVSVFPLGF